MTLLLFPQPVSSQTLLPPGKSCPNWLRGWFSKQKSFPPLLSSVPTSRRSHPASSASLGPHLLPHSLWSKKQHLATAPFLAPQFLDIFHTYLTNYPSIPFQVKNVQILQTAQIISSYTQNQIPGQQKSAQSLGTSRPGLGPKVEKTCQARDRKLWVVQTKVYF